VAFIRENGMAKTLKENLLVRGSTTIVLKQNYSKSLKR
jgi:hypothetical protein